MEQLRHRLNTAAFFTLLGSSLLFCGLVYDSYQLIKALFLLLSLALFCAAFFMRKEPLLFDVLSLAALFTGLWFFTSGLFSKNHPAYFYTLTLLTPFVFLFVRELKTNAFHFLYVISVLVFASSAYSVIQFLTGIYRPYSFFGNPIFLAEFTALCVPLMAALFILDEKRRLLTASNIILALTALFVASSRGAFISLALSLSFFAFFAAKEGAFRGSFAFLKRFWFVPVILLSLIVSMPGFTGKITANFSRLAEFGAGKSQAVENRLLMSRAGLDIFKAAPLTGAGSGAVSFYHQKYQSAYLEKSPGLNFVKTSYVHNDWIHTLSEFGMIGLAGLVIFIIFVFRSFDRASGRLDSKTYVFALSLVSSFLFLCIEAFFNFPLYAMPMSVFFWLLGGMICSLCREERGGVLKLNSKAAALIFAPVIIFISLGAPRETVSNYYLKKGFIEHSKRSNFEIDYLSKAYDINPGNFYTRALLGYSYSKTDKFDEASGWYEKALEIRPYSADIYYNLGANLRAAGRTKQAEEALLKAVSLFPYFPEANMTLGKLYIDSGEEEKGLYHFSLAKKSRSYFDFDMTNTVLDFRETTQ